MTRRQVGLFVMMLGATLAVVGGLPLKGTAYAMPLQVIGIVVAIAGSVVYRANTPGDAP